MVNQVTCTLLLRKHPVVPPLGEDLQQPNIPRISVANNLPHLRLHLRLVGRFGLRIGWWMRLVVFGGREHASDHVLGTGLLWLPSEQVDHVLQVRLDVAHDTDGELGLEFLWVRIREGTRPRPTSHSTCGRGSRWPGCGRSIKIPDMIRGRCFARGDSCSWP